MTCSIWVGNTWYVHQCMSCRLISSRCIHLSLSYFTPEINYPVLALFPSKTPENLTAKPPIILEPIWSHGPCLLTAVPGELKAFVVIEAKRGKHMKYCVHHRVRSARSKGFSYKHRHVYLCLDYLKCRRIVRSRENIIMIVEFSIKFCIRNRSRWTRREYGIFSTAV